MPEQLGAPRKVSKAGTLYYVACSQLWGALSTFNYLSEEYDAKVGQCAGKWTSNHGALANLLSEARFFPLDNEHVVKPDIDRLHAFAESLGDNSIFRWAEKLCSAGRDLHNAYSEITELNWVCLVYARWLCQTLLEFRGVLRKTDLQETAYSRLSNDIHVEVQALSDLLRNEEAEFSRAIDAYGETAELLKADLETYALRLAEDWRASVIKAANDFQGVRQ